MISGWILEGSSKPHAQLTLSLALGARLQRVPRRSLRLKVRKSSTQKGEFTLAHVAVVTEAIEVDPGRGLAVRGAPIPFSLMEAPFEHVVEEARHRPSRDVIDDEARPPAGRQAEAQP